MNKWIPILLTTLLSTSCKDIETALIIQRILAPDDDEECAFEASGQTLLDVTFDAYFNRTLWLNLAVQNTLTGGEVAFSSDDKLPDNFTIPSAVTPLRFDLRWECETNAFGVDLGPLYLPHFSSTDPFCFSDRDANNEAFKSSDAIPASGGIIQPNGGTGVVNIRPITGQLGEALLDTFGIASAADACCEAAPAGCDDATLAQKTNVEACTNLQALFDGAAGANQLSAQRSTDIERFRPFAIFDFTAGGRPSAFQARGPAFEMRMTGILEGATGDGTLVNSTEFTESIHICARCGQDLNSDGLADVTASSACTQF